MRMAIELAPSRASWTPIPRRDALSDGDYVHRMETGQLPIDELLDAWLPLERRSSMSSWTAIVRWKSIPRCPPVEQTFG